MVPPFSFLFEVKLLQSYKIILVFSYFDTMQNWKQKSSPLNKVDFFITPGCNELKHSLVSTPLPYSEIEMSFLTSIGLHFLDTLQHLWKGCVCFFKEHFPISLCPTVINS